MEDTEKEAETQAEEEAGSMRGAQHRTRSWVSRIRPWAEGSTELLSHPGCPVLFFKDLFIYFRGSVCMREWEWEGQCQAKSLRQTQSQNPEIIT